MRRTRPNLCFPRFALLLGLLASGLLACPASDDENADATTASGIAEANAPTISPATPPTPLSPTSQGTITAANIYANEASWPNIAALVEPWTPPGEAQPLKKGYRGAVIRVQEDGLVRIDFGRHGEHDIPIAATDLVSRANDVEAGTRHKVAPNFLAHFGTQFLHPTTFDLAPFPTPELAKSDRFLCVFADPSGPDFEALAAALAALAEPPAMQGLFFPVGLSHDQTQAVKDRLQSVGWAVPFAYAAAADKLAESLLGEIPTHPTALVVTSEGRVLHRSVLSEPGALEALRAATSPPSL